MPATPTKDISSIAGINLNYKCNNDAPNRTEPFRSVTETETVGSVEKPGFRPQIFVYSMYFKQQGMLERRRRSAWQNMQHAREQPCEFMQHTREQCSTRAMRVSSTEGSLGWPCRACACAAHAGESPSSLARQNQCALQ